MLPLLRDQNLHGDKEYEIITEDLRDGSEILCYTVS